MNTAEAATIQRPNNRVNNILYYHTTNMNIAISQEAIEIEMAEEQIHTAMTKRQDDLTAVYKEASRFVPELVEKESDPRWFLR
jgi:hypothetical protein